MKTNVQLFMFKIITFFAIASLLFASVLAFGWVRAERGPSGESETVFRLRSIGTAFSLHDEILQGTPRAVAYRDAQGKPLLSWRVALLPFLEEEALYREFHLDAPWDSPHNLALLPRIPRVYDSMSEKQKPLGFTHFQRITEKGFLAEETLAPVDRGNTLQLGRRWTSLPSGSVIVVTAREAVPWTAPMDLDADDGRPLLPRLDGRFGGYVVNRADGGSLKLPLDLSEAEFRVMLGRYFLLKSIVFSYSF
jgi:hypothetical protein